MSSKSRKNRSKKRQNPQTTAKNTSSNTAEIEDKIIHDKAYPAPRRSGEKPLILRIIVLAMAAVMLLGIVISAFQGASGGFF